MANAFDALRPSSDQPEAARPQFVRPKSAVNHGAALVSLCGAIAVLAAFKILGSHDMPFCLVAIVIFIALPHAALAMANWESPEPAQVAAGNLKRVAIKLWGQICLFALLALAYFVFQGFSTYYLLPLTDLG